MGDLTYYKGKVGKEDVEFGTGSFTRLDQNKNNVQKTQINLGDIPRLVIPKTTNYTIPDSIKSANFNNYEATVAITFTLPVAVYGLGPYLFLVDSPYQITVDPNGTNYFRDCAAGKSKSSSGAGNRLVVWCLITNIWEWDYELADVSKYWADEA